MAAGYSGRPLHAKLGYSGPVWRHEMPPEIAEEIAQGADIVWQDGPKGAVAGHVFATERAIMEAQVHLAREYLPDDGMLWLSWPKKSSKVPTDITEDTLRDIALPTGFVDVKVCAVSDIWSGLKFMVRKELRKTP